MLQHWETAMMAIIVAGSLGSAAFGAERELPPLPQASSSLGVTACDGWLYVYGGHTGKTHDYSTDTVSGKFQRMKLDGGSTWEELPAGPAVQGMNLAADRGSIYRVGGMQPRNKPGEPADNHSIADAAVFDPAAKRWQPLAPLPEPRSSHDLVVCNGKLYVVGGWVMRGAGQTTVWPKSAFVLDLERPGATWQPLPQPFQRRALTAAAVNGKLYVLGGLTEDGDAAQSVSILDSATGQWSDGPAFPGKGVGFSPAACEAGGRLVLSTSDGKVHRLATSGTSWEQAGEMAVPRMVHRLVPLRSDAVAAVGGASRKGDARIVESIELKTAR